MKKHLKRIIIIGGSGILCLLFGAYAVIVIGDSEKYRISPDQGYVCLTGPSGMTNKYGVQYDSPVQDTDLFIPKKTVPEFTSFINAATSQNNFYVTDAFVYDLYDYYGNLCGTGYMTCNYGGLPGYDDGIDRICDTVCGTVYCRG